jgi:hypothetical protein
MGNISLTQMVFAGLVGTYFIASLFGVYFEFSVINGITIEEPYSTAFQDIAGQYAGFETIAETSSDQGLVKNILSVGENAITGAINVFVVGLDAVGSFFSLIPIIGNVFSAVSNAVPGFSKILGLLTIIISLYIAMRYIQTVTNKTELP